MGILMHAWVVIAIFLGLFGAFMLWYGGNGKPLTPDEIEHYLHLLSQTSSAKEGHADLEEIRALVQKDDGREFIMHNLVRYRKKALYPEGKAYTNDPRVADRRYGRLLMPHLLRYGGLPVMFAKRTGTFITPDGADAWSYIAQVRYRSRRDFLRFVLAISTHEVVLHKWAALEKTHVFPVNPALSLFMMRTTVFLALFSMCLIVLLAIS